MMWCSKFSMLIIFKGIPPAKKNSKRVFVAHGKPRVLPSERHEAWKEEQLWYLKKFPKRKIEKCKAYAGFFPSNLRKFDMSNSFESIADILVDAEIIKDDNIFLLQEHTCKFMGMVPVGEERVEFILTELL